MGPEAAHKTHTRYPSFHMSTHSLKVMKKARKESPGLVLGLATSGLQGEPNASLPRLPLGVPRVCPPAGTGTCQRSARAALRDAVHAFRAYVLVVSGQPAWCSFLA